MHTLYPSTLRYVLWLLLFAVCGSPLPAAADSTWTQLFPDYPTHGYNDIYAADNNNIFAVGDIGLISHYNGTTWSTMASPVNDNLNAVWGRSKSDVFAVGDNATILHYNGSAWQKISNPASPAASNLYSVWGLAGASNPVYVGGENGVILKYSSGTWSFMVTEFANGIWDTVFVYGIWGYSADNLYAVGYRAGGNNEDIFIKCTDGVNWTAINTFPGSQFRPTAIWGSTGGLMYIAGKSGIYSLTNGGNTWTSVLNDSDGIADIWGASANDIWGVGLAVHHWDGGSWSKIQVNIDPQNLWGGLGSVSGSGSSSVVATGSAGRILHYQGSAWSSMTSVPEYPIRDIWGDSDSSVCAVGENGLILFGNGSTWHPMASASNEDLYAVCGWGNGHFLAAGVSGTVQYYDGSSWSLVTNPSGETLYDLWCMAPDGAFAVGRNGTILNCNGVSCAPEATDGATSHLYGVYSSNLGSFAAGAGGILLQKGATTWTTIIPNTPLYFDWTDLWGGTGYNVGLIAVSANKICSYNVTTKNWTKVYEDPGYLSLEKLTGNSFGELRAVGWGGTSPYDGRVLDNSGTLVQSFSGYHPFTAYQVPSGNLYLGGEQIDQNSPWHGQVLRYDGSSWGSMIENNGLTDIWGGDLDSVFVVGHNGTILHYDGSSVNSMQSNTFEDLSAVYAGDNDNWACTTGGLGKMFIFDGSNWSSAVNSSTEWMNDLWGRADTVYGVGDNGVILKSINRGANWSPMTNSSTEPLYGVWGASAAGPLFAVGYHGTVLQYSGGTWDSMASSAYTQIALNGVWGTSADDVYAVGHSEFFLGANESQIIHFDGNSWEESYYSHNVLPAKYLWGLWGSSDRDIIAFGTPDLRKECGKDWSEMSVPGIPPLRKGWGKEDLDGNYHIFGISSYDSLYHLMIPAGQDCTSSSPWNLFLPAIIGGGIRK